MMHTVGTTVMRCVELCARRLGPALVGRWTERTRPVDQSLTHNVLHHFFTSEYVSV